MSTGLSVAACLLAWGSAIALYAGSAHCRLRSLRALQRRGSTVGLVLAGFALALAVAGLGAGAGLCLMLGNWMLAAMLVPWLGAWGEVTSPSPLSSPPRSRG